MQKPKKGDSGPITYLGMNQDLHKRIVDAKLKVFLLKMKEKEVVMGQKAEIRLDILIKRVDDYYQAHCLQFDIVATSDSLGEVRKDIIDLCRAHIENAYEYDNLEDLFSPAPKEVWAEYLAMSRKEGCDVETRPFDDSPHVKQFSAQEIYCYA